MKTPWKLEDRRATLLCGEKQGIIDLDSPEPVLGWDKEQKTLGIRLGDSAGPSAYTRGDDLVVTWPASAKRPTQIQAYWQVGWCRQFPKVQGADLVVSAQTDFLDTDPKLVVWSTVTGEEMLKWGGEQWCPLPSAECQNLRADCLLIRGSDQSSFVQMVHPDDFRQTHLHEHAGRVTVEHELFESQLEKGVILRARIRAAWVPAARDAQVALDVFSDLVQSKLPLTT